MLKTTLKNLTFVVFFLLFSGASIAQNDIWRISGTIYETEDFPLPFVTLTVPALGLGTTANEEGQFLLIVNEKHAAQKVKVSMMGFKTFSTTVGELHKNPKIFLKQEADQLEAVEILAPNSYAESFIGDIKKTFIRKKHHLRLLYRRASAEDGVAKHLIEQVVDVVDKAGAVQYGQVKVMLSRESADYRGYQLNQDRHAIRFMNSLNPFRANIEALRRAEWEKVETQVIDDELVVVLKAKAYKNVKLYLGTETNNLYQLEWKSGGMDYLNRYAKNKDGKMYLSYHRRIWEGGNKTHRVTGEKMKVSYLHEAIVLRLKEEDYKSFSTHPVIDKEDLTYKKLPYKPNYWESLSLPPKSKFYKKIEEDLEAQYGVPLEKQFEIIGKQAR